MKRRFSQWHAFGGIALLMVGSLGLGIFALVGGSAATDIFHFISLLIIFMTALAATALVFFGLRLSNSREAFGLPTGSIRALIAIGIMILFVVFGLPLASGGAGAPTRIADTPLATATVPADAVQAAIEQHEKQGLVVVVTDYGRRAAANGPTDPGIPAKVQYYQRIKARPPEELDFTKQLLTAIVTLLTTVVGFYFGAQSVSEGVKRVETTGSPQAPPPGLAARLSGAGGTLSSLKAAASSVSQRLDAAKPAVDQSGDEQRKAALAEASALRSEVEAGMRDLDSAFAAASAAFAKLQKAPEGSERNELESAFAEQLQKLEDLIAAATERQEKYAALAGAVK